MVDKISLKTRYKHLVWKKLKNFAKNTSQNFFFVLQYREHRERRKICTLEKESINTGRLKKRIK